MSRGKKRSSVQSIATRHFFSKRGNFLPDSPAVRNPFVQYSVMKAGEAVKTDGVWINPFAAK